MNKREIRAARAGAYPSTRSTENWAASEPTGYTQIIQMAEISSRTPNATALLHLPNELLRKISFAAGCWRDPDGGSFLTCRAVCRGLRGIHSDDATSLLWEAFGSVVWRAMDTGRAGDVRRILSTWGPEKTAEFLATPAPEKIDKRRRMPLRVAVFRGHIDVVSVLLDSGAVVDLPHAGCSELAVAVEHGNSDIVRLLLAAGADPTASDPRGRSILFVAQVHNEIVHCAGPTDYGDRLRLLHRRFNLNDDGKIAGIYIEVCFHKCQNRSNRRAEYAEVMKLLRGTEQLRGTAPTRVELMQFRTSCIYEALIDRVVRTSEGTRALLPIERAFAMTLPLPLPRTRSGARANAASAELDRANARGVMVELITILRNLPALRTPANVRLADDVRQMATFLVVVHAFEADDALSAGVLRWING